MKKNVAVLFSGGLDSTYLVWKNLSEGNTVYPVYIEITNNQVKSVLEKNRIELLRKEFLKEFNIDDSNYKQQIRYINYLLTAGVDANESALRLRQLPVWMMGLSFMQSMEVDEIQIGYVSNDDAISYLPEIQAIYKSYENITEKQMIPLVFPLIKKHKWEMATELPKQYMKLIISCEGAHILKEKDRELIAKHSYGVSGVTTDLDYIIEYEPCCECQPCKTIMANGNYYGVYEFPENYKKRVTYNHIWALYREGYKVYDKDGNNPCHPTTLDEPKFAPYQMELPLDWYNYIPMLDDCICKGESPYSEEDKAHLKKIEKAYEDGNCKFEDTKA
jgi:7-cyano-7-deazaguanine synthase in queuosine biosynthesis